MFERQGHRCALALTKAEGLLKASVSGFDLVFLDVDLPDGNGLDMIGDLHDTASQPQIIILTGVGDAAGAEMAIINDAWDYIEKGSSVKNILLSAKRALQYRQEKLAHFRPVALVLDCLVGKSQAMKRCYDLVAQAAFSQANVLISGETGTGKELIARAIHQNSSRSDKNFVVVDCAALPPSMIESALFGHRKGAFTGADYVRKGLVAQAENGTLFLDEVGELPLEMQKIFLRVLQEHSYRPLGDDHEQQSNFRLIAATNRDLAALVQAGKFRQDLFFRLKTLEIESPPLRRRLDDISELVNYHQKRIAAHYDGNEKSLSVEFLDVLAKYEWPGNVRELVNAVEFAFSKAGHSATLLSQHLSQNIRIAGIRQLRFECDDLSAAKTDLVADGGEILPLSEYRLQMDRLYFEKLMAVVSGEAARAIKISGLSRSAFYALQKKIQ